MSGCTKKGHKHTLLCRAKVNTEPLTRDNMALVGYVNLIAANDLRRDGMPMFARVLEKTGTALTLEHGRLPPGLHIPDDLWADVYNRVVSELRAAAIRAAPTDGEA